MSFSIITTERKGINLIQLHNEKEAVTAAIAVDHGAMLDALTVSWHGQSMNIIDNYEDSAAIAQTLSLSYKSSKLSPFACRIPNGQYTWKGQLFEFQNKFIDGSAIHGLLFNKPFQVKETTVTDYHCSVLLEYEYHADDPGYPFHYSCSIRYTLFPNRTLQLQTTVTNLDQQDLPMADGWHPYFTLGDTVNDYLLQFPSEGMVEFDEKLIPTGRILDYDRFNDLAKFGDTQLDNCFLLQEGHYANACQLLNPNNGLQLTIATDENYPYLQIYTPDHRKSIALENLSGAPDCFNNKMGLVLLQPGTSKQFTTHYRVDIKGNA